MRNEIVDLHLHCFAYRLLLIRILYQKSKTRFKCSSPSVATPNYAQLRPIMLIQRHLPR